MPDKPTSMSTFISFIAIMAGVYAIIVLLMFLGQSRLVYFPDIPSREHGQNPDSIGLAY